jgi:hypothetical protein
MVVFVRDCAEAARARKSVAAQIAIRRFIFVCRKQEDSDRGCNAGGSGNRV